MKKEIARNKKRKLAVQIVREELKKIHETTYHSRLDNLLGLCGINYSCYIQDKIDRDDFFFIKGKLGKKAERTYQFWDSDLKRTLCKTQFIWKPFNFKCRDKFLKELEDSL